MSIRFQADNDLRRAIIDATLRVEPSIDFQSARAANLDSMDDESVLRLCSAEGRILVSHDKRTIPGTFQRLLALGESSPGVLLVIPQDASLPKVAETLVLIWADNHPDEWINLVTKIPF